MVTPDLQGIAVPGPPGGQARRHVHAVLHDQQGLLARHRLAATGGDQTVTPILRGGHADEMQGHVRLAVERTAVEQPLIRRPGRAHGHAGKRDPAKEGRGLRLRLQQKHRRSIGAEAESTATRRMHGRDFRRAQGAPMNGQLVDLAHERRRGVVRGEPADGRSAAVGGGRRRRGGRARRDAVDVERAIGAIEHQRDMAPDARGQRHRALQRVGPINRGNESARPLLQAQDGDARSLGVNGGRGRGIEGRRFDPSGDGPTIRPAHVDRTGLGNPDLAARFEAERVPHHARRVTHRPLPNTLPQVDHVERMAIARPPSDEAGPGGDTIGCALPLPLESAHQAPSEGQAKP